MKFVARRALSQCGLWDYCCSLCSS